MGWIKDITNPKLRQWEEFYRNRHQHDKIVRSTHGVNCTGGCSWGVYVKDGVVTWELQQTDYPQFSDELPPYEPRGCQRGISASWYVYSPIRVKYPYIKGALLDFWEEALKTNDNPIDAWASIVENNSKRSRYQRARGKGGFRRTSWDKAAKIIAASCLYTAKKWGPDRIFAFSPIPAMSMFSFAGGSRFMQLLGGSHLSFYDWYCDLPPAFPEVWGDQTDVAESADWYNGKFIVVTGTTPNRTRTPDVHFLAEARYNGAKLVVLSPDFSQVSKYADWWIPVKAGQDTAFWMAVNHVILNEFYEKRTVPYFVDYIKQYSDMSFLVELKKDPSNNSYKSGQYVRANRISRYKNVENGDWKFLIYDKNSNEARMPGGTVGFRWDKKETGKWNLKLEDGLDGNPIDPAITFKDDHDDVLQVDFDEFESKTDMLRGVPVKRLKTENDDIVVATLFDLIMAEFGVSRGFEGDYPANYDDPKPYTPAWQEQITGIGRKTVIRFAREFAKNAELTKGKSMVIIGPGINHWYHNDQGYRLPATALIITGCPGTNGGGMNHYVGQEKLAPVAPWAAIQSAGDWTKPPRFQQSPTWHYMNSDQWRYEGDFTEYNAVPKHVKWAKGHVADLISDSVKMGWMPSYPQFNKNPLEVMKEARKDGVKSDADVSNYVINKLKSKKLDFAIDNPDAKENWPRVWIIWRGNAIGTSAKGHEYFLRHYLGTNDNAIADERAEGSVKTVKIDEPAPRGKMDLVVDVNFRMDTSALYSDIVLPTAMWYEKNDLNTTDMHSYIHPLGAAINPSWQSKSDWDIFKLLAKEVSRLSKYAFDEPAEDIVMSPLMHDSPDEISQTDVKKWYEGECEAIPGKTMPHFSIVKRDYSTIYNKFISFGRNVRDQGIGAHGAHLNVKKFYDELMKRPVGGTVDPRRTRCVEWEGEKYPSLEDVIDAANITLYLAPETNGDVSYEGFKSMEEKTGVKLSDLAQQRGRRLSFLELQKQPQRLLTSPCWSGNINEGRAYSAWTLNKERLIPWRTLTGRQHIYIDHKWFIDFGENFPVYKPKLSYGPTGDLRNSPDGINAMKFNLITPHGKWHIHSTYGDTLRMMTLSRGIEPCWMSEKDAEKMGIKDNDWVEVFNDNGVVVTRAVVSSRIPSGTCWIYHATERTIGVPKSPLRGNKRAGMNNSLTRCRLNPVLLAGGYGQFTYHINYWGPTGVNRDSFVAIRKLDKVTF